METAAIRGWLLCQPRPAKIRVVADDGQRHELDVTPGSSWARIAASVQALRPDLVEACDAAGKLIRAIRPDEHEDEDEEEETEEGVPVNTADPESMRLITFARLLSEAYRYSTETAFKALVELFQAVTARSAHLEQTADRLHRTVMQQAVDAAVAQNASGDNGVSFESLMAQAFLQGQKNGAAKPTDGSGGQQS